MLNFELAGRFSVEHFVNCQTQSYNLKIYPASNSTLSIQHSKLGYSHSGDQKIIQKPVSAARYLPYYG